MSVAQPWLFALAVLALPLVGAYLHRRRRKNRTVSSTMLFRVIAGDNTPTRRALATPRHLLSLIVMLLALLAGVLAGVDLRPADAAPRDYIVVMDASASMGARIEGASNTRLDDARDALADALDALGPGDRVALITSGTDTSVRVGLTEDFSRVLALASAVEANGSSDALPSALRIADAMAQRSSESRIVLLTDGVGVTVPALSREPEIVTVGTAGPNIGINALAVREADAFGLAEVYISISSDTGATREAELVLMVDASVVEVLPIEIPSKDTVEVLHRVKLPEGDRVVARLQNHGSDVLSVDDEASTSRVVGERVRVTLVTRSRVSFIAEALRLHPRVDLQTLGPFDTAPTDPSDLLILETDYKGPLPTAPRVLVLGADPTRFGVERLGRVPAPEIMRWSFDDPLFRFVDLESIEIPRSDTLRLGKGDRSLLDSEAGSLAVQTRFEDRDVVVFGFAPHDSDLVLRVGFVNFIANVVEWAAPLTDEGPATAPPSVLPATETMLDPVRAIPGTTHGSFADRPASETPLWRWLAWTALGLLVFEGLLPYASLARTRLRSWRRKKASS